MNGLSNSLYIGASGLTATGDAMSIVGDDISNASTIGFKSQRAEFSDILGGQLGSQQLGDGVRLSGEQTMWTQGAIQQTGNPLDVAIQGGGMFQVAGNYNGQQGDFYTRDGQFQMDTNGYMVDSAGLRLQGYTIDGNGVQSSSVGDLDVGARMSPPVPTSTANMNVHLPSEDPANGPFDPANPSTTSAYSTPIETVDSLGHSHHTDVYFTNDGGGKWEWHAMTDGKEVTGGTPGTPSAVASGTLQFNTDGTLQSQTQSAATVNFAGGATAGQSVKFNFGDDIASGGTGRSGTMATDSGGAGGTVISNDVNGHSSGNLTSMSIGTDGTVTGTYDNGDKLNIAKVALATFVNQDGLDRAGGGLMTATAQSGQPAIGAPGTGARGSLDSGALESSNVDLGSQLVTLIAYQQAFQANSKTVTTADQMLQDVMQLKQ
jgi:flagellar hook protein FlgE